jgi:hypothetical protein
MIRLGVPPPKETRRSVRTRRRLLESAMYGVVSFNGADPVADREHVEHGTYATDADAVNAAKRLIDEQLLRAIATGLSAETAFREWLEFGEIPLIIPMANVPPVEFDPYSYAVNKAQCAAENSERALIGQA